MKLELKLANPFVSFPHFKSKEVTTSMKLTLIDYDGDLSALLDIPAILDSIADTLSHYSIIVEGLMVDNDIELQITFNNSQYIEIPDSLVLATVEIGMVDILSEEECHELHKSLHPQVINVLLKGTKIILPTSYGDCCSENNPCDECLKMCNRYILREDTEVTCIGELQNNENSIIRG